MRNVTVQERVQPDIQMMVLFCFTCVFGAAQTPKIFLMFKFQQVIGIAPACSQFFLLSPQS
jgi:hypothetical protein